MATSIAVSQERLEELERHLDERTTELLGARKELEDFHYSVSHDLRAPLRHISGYGQVIQEDYGRDLNPQCRKYFEGIQEAARRMGMMLDELLKLSRLGRQELCRKPVALETLFRDLSREVNPETTGRVVEWKIRTLPQVECDPIMMKQAISNLVANAMKFTRTRAHAVIEVGTTGQDGAETIFIRDNGVGFDMKYADKLFNIFQRLHPQQDFEGIGAGLAITRVILGRHGGRIWADAAVDQGATFYFTLDGTKITER